MRAPRNAWVLLDEDGVAAAECLSRALRLDNSRMMAWHGTGKLCYCTSCRCAARGGCTAYGFLASRAQAQVFRAGAPKVSLTSAQVLNVKIETPNPVPNTDLL